MWLIDPDKFDLGTFLLLVAGSCVALAIVSLLVTFFFDRD